MSDNWERGNPYEQYVGRWSRWVAPKFLAWLDIPSGRRWLDLECGMWDVGQEHCVPRLSKTARRCRLLAPSLRTDFLRLQTRISP